MKHIDSQISMWQASLHYIDKKKIKQLTVVGEKNNKEAVPKFHLFEPTKHTKQD